MRWHKQCSHCMEKFSHDFLFVDWRNRNLWWIFRNKNKEFLMKYFVNYWETCLQYQRSILKTKPIISHMTNVMMMEMNRVVGAIVTLLIPMVPCFTSTPLVTLLSTRKFFSLKGKTWRNARCYFDTSQSMDKHWEIITPHQFLILYSLWRGIPRWNCQRVRRESDYWKYVLNTWWIWK